LKARRVKAAKKMNAQPKPYLDALGQDDVSQSVSVTTSKKARARGLRYSIDTSSQANPLLEEEDEATPANRDGDVVIGEAPAA
jgi:hypothetical protein